MCHWSSLLFVAWLETATVVCVKGEAATPRLESSATCESLPTECRPARLTHVSHLEAATTGKATSLHDGLSIVCQTGHIDVDDALMLFAMPPSAPDRRQAETAE